MTTQTWMMETMMGGEGMEGNELINDDERCDGKTRENIEDKDNAGVFDWNEIDTEIEQENRDHAERVAVPEGEESDRSYSPALCHNRSSKDIENDGNFNFSQNNNVVEHLNNGNDTVVGDNNITDRVDEAVAPIIQNTSLHGQMEIGSSSKSVPIFDSNNVENADSSRHSVHVEQMNVDSLSMTMAMPRIVMEDRGKGTIGTRIIEAARVVVATVIGGGRGMEENVVVEVNSKQNTLVQLEKMGSGTIITGDGMGTSRDGIGTSGDGNSVHHIPHISSVPAGEQGGTTADVISLGRPS